MKFTSSRHVTRPEREFAANLCTGATPASSAKKSWPLWGIILGLSIQARAQTPPVYTTVQAQQGERVYDASCSRCHGAHLDDGEFGPALAGHNFTDRWASRPVADLYDLTRQQMPPGAAGALTDTTYAQLIAFLLSKNGVAPATVELPADSKLLSQMTFPGNALVSARQAVGPSGGLAPGAVLPVWPPAINPLTAMRPVTDPMLQNPPQQDWLTWRRGFDDSGFSPLAQISKANVRGLRLAWSLALPAGPNEATPLVHDGVIFIHSYGDNVEAVDAATGSELWRYSRPALEGATPVVQRNMALYGDKLYFGSSDCHIVALDAASGKLVWETLIADRKLWRISGGPLVAKGRVMQGVVGRSAGGAFIVGVDAQTGAETWRFHSIAQPGQPGDATWNDTPLQQRTGGSVWTAGSYDSRLNLAYFGPAQTYDTAPLLHPVKKRGINNAGLYLDSTVAVDPDTGRLVWYYQHLPNDQWDYDWAFERQSMELNIDGKQRRLIVTGGKLGIYDAMDAASGKYVFSVDLGIQNLITAIDAKTGAKSIDPARYPDTPRKITVCPHSGGGRSWLPGSYNAATHVVVAPLVETCMDLIPTEKGEHGMLSSGFRWAVRPIPGSDGKFGRIQAVDLQNRRTLWTARQRAPQTSGVLATAGGLVFAGALDRGFTAYDDATGEVLWSTRLGDVPISAPISYMLNGIQYIAVVVGYGGAQSISFTSLVPEIKVPSARSSAIYVFELPQD